MKPYLHGMRQTLKHTISATVSIAMFASLLLMPPLIATSGATPAGGLFAFGENFSGELGNATNNATNNPNPIPALVALPGEVGPVTQVAAGAAHSLVVTSSGQLYAFGDNYYGELGYTPNSGTSAPNPTPTLVSLPGEVGTVTQVAAGDEYSLVVTSSGQLYAFGDNQYGQLGITTNSGTKNPNATPTLVSLPGEVGAVTRVAASSEHSLVVTSSGQLYAFGDNYYGELGNATNNHSATPNPTPTLVTLPGASGGVSEVAAGTYNSLAVTASGQLYSFGYNYYGELGSTTNSGTTNPNPTPTLVTLPAAVGSVTQVAAGETHALVATTSGQLYAFGDNQLGQLGTTTNSGTTNPNPTPTLVTLPGEVGSVTQIAAGEYDSLAVTSAGQLYAFGLNEYGELGKTANEGTNNPNPAPAVVNLPAGTTIDTIAAGTAYHVLAVVSDLTITSASLPDGKVAIAYSDTLTASGGAAPLSWSASGLPGGISINAQTGSLSGTPTGAGDFSVVVKVTDHFGNEVSQTFPVVIAANPKVRIASKHVVVVGRRARVRLSCRNSPCRGSARITESLIEHVKHGSATRTRKVVLVLARSIYRIRAGRNARIALRITPLGKRVFANVAGDPTHERLLVTVTDGHKVSAQVLVS